MNRDDFLNRTIEPFSEMARDLNGEYEIPYNYTFVKGPFQKNIIEDIYTEELYRFSSVEDADSIEDYLTKNQKI